MHKEQIKSHNKYLILAAIVTFIAALLHLGCIIFGGDWYRFLGAGEQMAVMSEQGHWYPAAVTSVIFIILMIWVLYALSGAKLIFRLPLLRLGLVTISSLLVLRGLAFFFIMSAFPENSLTFWLVSSGICLGLGLLYILGTRQAWAGLKPY